MYRKVLTAVGQSTDNHSTACAGGEEKPGLEDGEDCESFGILEHRTWDNLTKRTGSMSYFETIREANAYTIEPIISAVYE